MDTLNDFIRVHENALDSETCDFFGSVIYPKEKQNRKS